MILNSDNFVEAVHEVKRRQQHPINAFVPTEKENHNQLKFLKATTRYKLLFGGNQSGKSITAAFDLACYARGKHEYVDDKEIPKGDIKIWVISAEYITIKTGIYRHLKTFIPDWEIIREGPNVPGHMLPSYILVKRPSLSGEGEFAECEITFLSAKGENRQKFQAAAVWLFYIDEEIEEKIVEELEARTLITGGRFNISATLAESYDWILDLERRGESGDPNVSLTRLNTSENPYVHKETLEFLKNKWSVEAQEYRILGKSKRSTGLVYRDFDDSIHRITPFKIPKEWPKWCAIDPGIRICAVLWIAVDPQDHAYAYRELYFSNEPLYRIALEIKKCERWHFNEHLSNLFKHFVFEEVDESEHIVTRIIDDRRNSRLITGDEGVMDQLSRKYGIMTIPADKGLTVGLEDVRYWLEIRPDNKPGFMVFDNLINFYNEVKSYRIRERAFRKNQNDPIDIPVKKRDHLMDCWRYISRENPKYIDRLRLMEYLDPTELKNKKISDRIREKKEEREYSEFGNYW